MLGFESECGDGVVCVAECACCALYHARSERWVCVCAELTIVAPQIIVWSLYPVVWLFGVGVGAFGVSAESICFAVSWTLPLSLHLSYMYI